ncbi:MAG: glycosyltransferase family 2 protein [Candidatus Binatia bacterium]
MTYNEEPNIEQCLRSVQGLTQNIFIVDSGSEDRTLELGYQYNAHVVTHEFVNQAQQFNWALDNLPIQSGWILRLDADEYLLPELRTEIASVLPELPAEVSGLYMKRRLIFLGRWIRHGGHYPIWLLRLFRYGKARSEQVDINEHIVLLEGMSQRLKHDFVDENHKGLAFWTFKHEGHAARKAHFLCKLQQGYDPAWIRPKLVGTQEERKRWLMHNLYRHTPLFARAFLYFLYRYVLRLGFLDGPQGLIFHFLHGCWYPFYTDAKMYDQKLRGDK